MEREEREKNRTLFHKVLALGQQELYDDDYLKALIDFWQFSPVNEADGNILYAQYALYHKNYPVAYEHGQKAYKLRKINLQLWRILRDSSYALGKYAEAFLYAGFADKFYREPVQLDIPQDRLKEALDSLSLGLGRGNFAPVAEARMFYSDKGLENHAAIFAGEFLPREGEKEEFRLFSGAYVEQEMLDYKGQLLSWLKDNPDLALISGADFIYDLIRVAERGQDHTIPVEDEDVLIGLVGSEAHQRVDFHARHEDTADYLGQWAASFFRLTEETKLHSEKTLLCTKPIVLHHDPKRCKVVLNILLDGLCWRAVQEQDYELVPNILKFFREGVIFSNHYAVSEFTFPALATIETGLYPYHSQIFNEHASHELNREYKSISERLQEAGYYSVNIMGDGAGVYDGVTRGYDRLLVTAYDARAYRGIERTLHHLEAFGGTDQFIFLHASDTHPWGAHTFQLPLATQTAFSLYERSMKNEEQKTSVYLPKRPIYHHWNSQGIKDCDAALARLFAYLEEHYEEDEYLISVYSDHGTSIYDDVNYVLSEHHTGAAWMMRGRNVPHKGFVEEMTSALDIYPALAKCLDFPMDNIDGNLPAVFGGRQREYTVSMSIFPGLPFMVCIRTADYECRAESQGLLDEDGRTELADMKVDIYQRSSGERVQDKAAAAYFQDILVQETCAVDSYGTQWPEMRAARPEWFAEREKT